MSADTYLDSFRELEKVFPELDYDKLEDMQEERHKRETYVTGFAYTNKYPSEVFVGYKDDKQTQAIYVTGEGRAISYMHDYDWGPSSITVGELCKRVITREMKPVDTIKYSPV